nr:sigma 54-interacting transcriptional regulator [Azospirillum thermophilum]
MNCAALPESLLESELFGHEKGAFTGAQKDHKGRFELASGGTLFLDEIGDISSNFQAKLLRVLQEQEFERIGGTKTIKTDVRLICATNLNLEEAVGHGKFRADLYFRINVVTIHLPPLRERRGDIAVLARHFVAKFAKDNGLSLTIDQEALDVLNRCTWPGNVRELENCVERAATQCRDGVIRVPDLSCSMNLCNSSILFQYRTMGSAVGGLAPSMGPGSAPPGAPAAPAPRAPAATLPAPAPAPAGGGWPACASGCSAGPAPTAVRRSRSPPPPSPPAPAEAGAGRDGAPPGPRGAGPGRVTRGRRRCRGRHAGRSGLRPLARTAGLGDGAHRLGAGQGRPAAGHDHPAGELRAAQIQYRNQEVLSPVAARRQLWYS